jgi:hypothetical protein
MTQGCLLTSDRVVLFQGNRRVEFGTALMHPGLWERWIAGTTCEWLMVLIHLSVIAEGESDLVGRHAVGRVCCLLNEFDAGCPM